MLTAVTRGVSPAIGRCELTHIPRAPIDIAKAREQHASYENALRSLGVEVVSLPSEADMPDSVFVEDTAVVLDELAVITCPGAESRREETVSIVSALAPYRELSYIMPPGTIDGGDVLRVGRTLFIGLSGRTNQEAVDQLRAILAPYGYLVIGLPIAGCLHLKSAVTAVAADALLINPGLIRKDNFPGFGFIEVDPSESAAANALAVGDTLVFPNAFPKTRARLETAGFRILPVDVSELAKAEGAVTCCSLIFEK